MGDFFDMENTFTDDTVDMLELVKRYRTDNIYVFYASLYEGIRITISGCTGALPPNLLT